MDYGFILGVVDARIRRCGVTGYSFLRILLYLLIDKVGEGFPIRYLRDIRR